MEIEYVSMHAIQRRMQAEGLGQEAVVEHLAFTEREACLNQMRLTWEPVIRRELKGARRLNPKQQFAIESKYRQRHGGLATYWLAPNWMCYTISQRGEVLTVYGIDNATADALDALGKFEEPDPSCAYQNCSDPAKYRSRFCKEHAEVGPEHERRLQNRVSEAMEQLRKARIALDSLVSKKQARDKLIEKLTPLRRCAYKESCRRKPLGHSFYCKEHVGIARNQEALLSLEISAAESTLDHFKNELAKIQTEIQGTFKQTGVKNPSNDDPRTPIKNRCEKSSDLGDGV